MIHGEDEVIFLKVLSTELPGGVRDGDMVLLASGHSPGVGILTDMVAGGTAAVHLELIAMPLIMHNLLEHGLSHRASADVS